MATKNMSLRTILTYLDDIGATDRSPFDETLTLSGYSDATPGRRLTLAAAASDQAVTFTSGALVFIFSHDNTFKVRLASGETLMSNLRQFGPVMVNVATNNALSTSILLTGNGTTTADLEIHIIEKYTP